MGFCVIINMKTLNRIQIAKFAAFFLEETNDVNAFVNLCAKKKSEKAKISLLDRLINSTKTRLNSIKRGKLSAVPDPSIFVYEAYGKGKKEVFEKGRWVKKLQLHRMLWCEDVDGRFKFVIESQGEVALLTLAEVNPELQGMGLFSELVAAIRLVCFDHYNFKGVKGRAAIPQTSLFNENQPDRAEFTGEAVDDWRCSIMRGEESSDETNADITKLLDLWLRQRLVYRMNTLSEMSADDEFVILSEYTARNLDKETIRRLEESFPKAANQALLNTD